MLTFWKIYPQLSRKKALACTYEAMRKKINCLVTLTIQSSSWSSLLTFIRSALTWFRSLDFSSGVRSLYDSRNLQYASYSFVPRSCACNIVNVTLWELFYKSASLINMYYSNFAQNLFIEDVLVECHNSHMQTLIHLIQGIKSSFFQFPS